MGLKKERAEKVIEDLFNSNESLTKVLERHEVEASNFFKLLSEVPSLDEEYARAQKARAEVFADEIIEIADNENDSQKARNRIDARKWYASKMQPNKFGDRIDVNMTGTVDIRGALDEANNRIRAVLEIPKTQIAETTEQSTQSATGSKPADSDADVIKQLDELLS